MLLISLSQVATCAEPCLCTDTIWHSAWRPCCHPCSQFVSESPDKFISHLTQLCDPESYGSRSSPFRFFIPIMIMSTHRSYLDAYHGVLAARAIITPINIRLTAPEVSYIVEHSGSKLILADYEFVHLIKDTNVPVVVTTDTGREGDPYEKFLRSGRCFSDERGWQGLDIEMDEEAAAVLCYTSVVECTLWMTPCSYYVLHA
jgi:hypothetical protein